MQCLLAKTLEPKEDLQFLGSPNIAYTAIRSVINETTETIYVVDGQGILTTIPPLDPIENRLQYPGCVTVSLKMGFSPRDIDPRKPSVTARVPDRVADILPEENLKVARHLANPSRGNPNCHWNRPADVILPSGMMLSDSVMHITLDEIKSDSTNAKFVAQVGLYIGLDEDFMLKTTHPFIAMRNDHCLEMLEAERRASSGVVYELVDPGKRYGTLWYLEGETARCVTACPNTQRVAGLYIKRTEHSKGWTEQHFPLEGLLDGPKDGIRFWATAEEASKNTAEAHAALELENTKLRAEQTKAQARVEAAELDRISAARKDASDGIKFWATLVTALVTIISGLIAIFRR